MNESCQLAQINFMVTTKKKKQKETSLWLKRRRYPDNMANCLVRPIYGGLSPPHPDFVRDGDVLPVWV